MAKRKQYSLETEAAWFALRDFIDLNNCSKPYNGHVIPMNYKEIQCHLYSGTKAFRPFKYSKKLLDLHLRQVETHYYRSARHAQRTEGYQRYDTMAQRAIFAKTLGVTHRRLKHSKYYVILIGWDIDAHDNETDALEVSEWLTREYFRSLYWEPSTHLRGMHGYGKFAYPRYIALTEVTEVLTEVFVLLDQKRESMGFASSLDKPCGLPAIFERDDSIVIPESLPWIPHKEYVRYRAIRKDYEAGDRDHTNVAITAFRSYSDIDNIVRTPLPWSMKQSQCLKFPRFNRTDHTKPNIEDIKYFYDLPYYSFEFFLELRDKLKKEIGGEERKPGESVTADSPPPSEEKNTALPEPCHAEQGPEKKEPNKEKREEREKKEMCNIVRSPHKERPEMRVSTKSSPASVPVTEVKYRRRTGVQRLNEVQYMEAIEATRKIPNKAAMTNSFYFRYSDYLGHIPSIKEAEAEYIRLGLNRTPSKGIYGRIRRLKKAKERMESLWEARRGGFHITDWEQKRAEMVSSISPRVEQLDRMWTKGEGRSGKIKVEELAFAYYALLQSNQADERHDNTNHRYAFSYRQMQNCFREVYGRGCHRAKVSKILAVLVEARLIVPVGSHLPGEHGKKYRAVRLKPHDNSDDPPGGAQQLSQGFT